MKHLLFLFGLIISLSAQAADTTAKIHEKDWEVGGSLTLSHGTDRGLRPSINVQGGAQYFFLDGFSGGIEGQFYKYGSYLAGSVAPVLTKYLWAKGNVAPYVTVAPVRATFQSYTSNYFSSSIRPGVKFFLNDNIAIGPALDYTHNWAHDGFKASGDISLLGMFSLHF